MCDLGDCTCQDRYKATGIALKHNKNLCKTCAGMGCFPLHRRDANTPDLLKAWKDTHRTICGLHARVWRAFRTGHISYLWLKCDGWHLILCPTCKGSCMKQKEEEEEKGVKE